MTFKNFMRYVRVEAPDTTNTLLALIWFNDNQNIIRATHERIAQETGKSLPTIARHMKRFRELGIVLNDTQVPHACYRIHPLVAWKGKSADRDAYIEGLGTDHEFSKLIEKLREYCPEEDESVESPTMSGE